MSLKRYDFFCSYDGGGPADAEESANGEFVRYEDAAILAQQVADLSAELQREHEDHNQANDDAATYMRECERLTAERDALRADAERYRWLRAQHPVDALVSFPGRRDIGGISYRRWNDYRGDDLDAAIDAARGKP